MQSNKPNESQLEKNNSFVANNAGLIQFLLIALALFFGLDLLYKHVLADSAFVSHYVAFLVNSTSYLLSLVGLENIVGEVDERAYRLGTDYGAYIDIEKSFTEYAFYAILIAATAAWPGNWLKKTGFMLAGILLLTALNIVRIICMLLVDIYIPLRFELFNSWIVPGAFVLFLFIYFLLWTKISDTHPLDKD